MTERKARLRLPVLGSPSLQGSPADTSSAEPTSGLASAGALSVFDMFKIGIGPSSSHTVGPMRAARRFAEELVALGLGARVARVKTELFGSLGHTGRGHRTDMAVILGLEGADPELVDTSAIPARLAEIQRSGQLRLAGALDLRFDAAEDLIFHKRRTLPQHPNALTLSALDSAEAPLLERTYFSIGGGFIVDAQVAPSVGQSSRAAAPFPFTSGQELLTQCRVQGLSVGSLALQNERAWREEAQITAGLLHIWTTMQHCVEHGLVTEGILPGGLKVKRRAATLHRRLKHRAASGNDPLLVLDWVNLFALAVSEENAAGGRVVTAPTNGAAGIIPAVLTYYRRFCPDADDDGVVRFLLAAGAIGMIYKLRASISGAEVGCQGEVGVACSMAAAGLAEALGGSPEQVEEAAEIGMEHNLGLTCDPVGGLVQVPCIERNAMGAVKAINAARLALQNDGQHKISLDRVIATMARTGADMNTKYKETARGGLAVNVPEC